MILAHPESLGNAGIPGHSCIFRNSCISGITRKCRNSCTFRNCKFFTDGPLNIYRVKINAKRNSGILAHPESLGNAGIPGDSCIFRNSCISGITGKCRNSCTFRNYKYLILLPSPSPTQSLQPTHSHHTLTLTLRQELQE